MTLRRGSAARVAANDARAAILGRRGPSGMPAHATDFTTILRDSCGHGSAR
ncbi:hypothetical protein L810_1757 [Burkholderia sp. AU4i]|nr:hypothetical protein L810_1757 [Burkholderia sp. AU4i]